MFFVITGIERNRTNRQFYAGFYIYEGEYFGTLTDDIWEKRVKKYKTRRGAKLGIKAAIPKCSYISDFKVEVL
jgi:hypothetical protein